jgi:pimeloyl-ACP methyl ester carboxylesterase
MTSSTMRLRLLPSAGHFSPLEAPDEFAAEILAAAGLTGHGKE